MSNRLLVQLGQNLPFRAAQALRSLARRPAAEGVPRINLLEDIDHFPTAASKQRRAILTLSPEAWLTALEQHPEIRLFNYYGLTYELVRALNGNGYIVDIADMTREHVPTKRYDLLVGHGGRCRTLIDHLPAEATILQYVSGAHWRRFNIESAERYRRFAQSRGIAEPQRFGRDLTGLLEGEDYLLEMAHCLFTIHCPRMIGTFGDESRFFFTGLGAYLDECLDIGDAPRDFDAGRSNFLYVGGTGGNVQKGLDVLIEAFARTPEANLLIYCKIEDEILDHYRSELELPNIRYIYHLRAPFFRPLLRRLMRRTVYSIHAPINSGMGTAFMGSMGLGLIPTGYVDLEDDHDCTVLDESWQPGAIAACIRRAMAKDPAWCRAAAKGAKELHNRYCGSRTLAERFDRLFSDDHIRAVRQRAATRSTHRP